MNNKEKLLIAGLSILVLLAVIALLALSGFDLSGMTIQKGVHIRFPN